MSRRRRRGTSRRRFLLYAGGGGLALFGAAAASNQTGAFSAIDADRISTVGVVSDDEGVVGIVEVADQGTVQKNNREPMIEITNNATDVVTYEVALDTCSDATLYNNEGSSGCTVTFDLNPGNAQFVDIEAAVTGTIGYSITTSGGLSFETSGSIEAESGNVKGNVRIKAPVKDKSFVADDGANVFEILKVDIEDDSATGIPLDKIKYEVRVGGSGGSIVAEKTIDLPPNTYRYNPNGNANNPPETIQPNSGEIIQSGTTYALTVRAENDQGDFNTETVEDTP